MASIRKPQHPRADSSGYVKEHIFLAEIATRKGLPPKAVVHHFTDEQLVICENHAYHMFLHQRQRAVQASGHANYIKCWRCKQHYHPTLLHKNSRWCKACQSAYDAQRRIKNKDKMRQWHAAWRAKNREKLRQEQRDRRARRAENSL